MNFCLLKMSPLADPASIRETVEVQLRKNREDFDAIALAGFEKIYLEIRDIRLSVPGKIHTCVTEAVEK